MNAEEKFNKLGMKKQVEDGVIEYTDGNTFIAFFKNPLSYTVSSAGRYPMPKRVNITLHNAITAQLKEMRVK